MWSICQPDRCALSIVVAFAICPLGTAHSINRKRLLLARQRPDSVRLSKKRTNPLP
jgi:hypothetical protein